MSGSHHSVTDKAIRCTPAETKAVRIDAVAAEERETLTHLKASTVRLTLLCFLPPTAVVPVFAL